VSLPLSHLPLSLALYRAATTALEPFAPLLLSRRAKAGKEDRARLHERLGRPKASRPEGRLVWLHGASVGESLSILPLVERLRAERPGVAVLVTSGTVTSAQLLARRLPAGAIHQFLPVDTPGGARRFLDHWRPDLAVFVESELWPNLLLTAKARGVKLALVSAKLSDKSFAGWRARPFAAWELFSGFDLILAQDGRAAERLASLGGTVAGEADLKFGAAPLPVDAAALASLRVRLSDRPVLLAASTHPGEDEIVLEAWRALPDRPRLVIVPRHTERGPPSPTWSWRPAPPPACAAASPTTRPRSSSPTPWASWAFGTGWPTWPWWAAAWWKGSAATIRWSRPGWTARSFPVRMSRTG
jgi:3-deoxy-D-manno-octulosonic-acid transferase